jgi:hypothetical protein
MQGRLMRTFRLVFFFGFIGSVALLVNFSATPASAQQPRGREYSAHLADLMNEAMQVHHTKLWLAGHANNWPLAAYQVKKLKETMEEIKEAIVDIQTASPKWQSVPVGEMLQVIDSDLETLGQAVKAKSPAKFEAAYSELTAACNACHARAGESQIKIIQPAAGNAYIDQDFTPGGASQ